MDIIAAEVRNFKSIRHIFIPWDKDIFVLYGPNGAGKSNIIKALNMLFGPERYKKELQEQSSEFEVAFYLKLVGFEIPSDLNLRDYLAPFLEAASLLPEDNLPLLGESDIYDLAFQLPDSQFSALQKDHYRLLIDKLKETRPRETRELWGVLLGELFKFRYFRVSVRRRDAEGNVVNGEPCLPPLKSNEELRHAIDTLVDIEKKTSQVAPSIFDQIRDRLRAESQLRAERPSDTDFLPIPVVEAHNFKYLYGDPWTWLEPPYLISLVPGGGEENLTAELRSVVLERFEVMSDFVARALKSGVLAGSSDSETGQTSVIQRDFLVEHYLKNLEKDATGNLVELGFRKHSLILQGTTSGVENLAVKVREPSLFPILLSDASSALRTWSTLSLFMSAQEFREDTEDLKEMIRSWIGPSKIQVGRPVDLFGESVDSSTELSGPEHFRVYPTSLDDFKHELSVNPVLSAAFTKGDLIEIEKWLRSYSYEDLKKGTHKVGAVLTVDEPELHLHPRLQHELATSLARLSGSNFKIVIATHSLDFLNLDSTQAAFFHARRCGNDATELVPLTPGDITIASEIAKSMGITRGQLLQLVRCFLFVEGDHDKIFFENLFGDFFSLNRVKIVPLTGASKMGSIVDARILRECTSAFIALLLDQMENAYAQALRDGAFREQELNNKIDGRKKYSSIEKKLIDLMMACDGKIGVYGLDKKDIFEYLDEETIKEAYPKFPGWGTIRTQISPETTSGDWKKFCQKCGIGMNSEFMKEITLKMKEREIEPQSQDPRERLSEILSDLREWNFKN